MNEPRYLLRVQRIGEVSDLWLSAKGEVNPAARSLRFDLTTNPALAYRFSLAMARAISGQRANVVMVADYAFEASRTRA